MRNVTTLSIDWKRWLDDNVERHCTRESIVGSMVKAGLDPIAVDIWVNAAFAEAAGAPARQLVAPTVVAGIVAGPYVYETPRLPQTGNLLRTSDRAVRVTMRMARPVVAVLDDLLSGSECDELIRLSTIKLQRSTIVDPRTGEQKVIDARSSYGTFFALSENPFIARLDRRIADVMHCPLDSGEGLQILNYRVGGEYKTHFDYFPPGDPGSAQHLARGGQRVSTLVIYLNDVEEAGETIFPEIGLSVVPKKGSAVYFEYCNSAGQVDALTLHGGTPVRAGEKWIATKWMRERRYG